ncbi:hypothetical protein [Mycolicibacterium thermoresistibile]
MSDLFFWLTVIAVGTAIVQSFFNHDNSSQRRIYWICVCIASITAFLMSYPILSRCLQGAAFTFGAMTLLAYLYTPYIKIDGQIYALTEDNRTADADDAESDAGGATEPEGSDSYSGLLSSAKMWWIQVILIAMSVINIYAYLTGNGEWWVAGIGVAFILFFSLVIGYGDGSWDYPFARGKFVQFGILTVITLGVYALLYFGAYSIARRRPIRSRHSMEYRAHRHLRRQFPMDDNDG